MKSGNLNFLEPSGPLQACNGTDLPLTILHTYLPMKMEQIECSETSAYKIQTPGNYREESIQQLKLWLQ